ncbi:hypothetical protein M9H77_02089 [Catharanthus roseus]|uniref:Uncharacterized protein n=1 Tax=Catharanthus roseus TaxID=4058 RepID=A0ACC0C7P9_CATRO|nr:hypothetical protein M9H77_02089 [Catharanthus roseus]
MVRPGARRGDDDLGPVTDRTNRVEDHVLNTSSPSVRGCHSTSNIPSTPVPFGQGDGDRTRFEELDMVGSLRIHGGEDEKDQPEDDGGDDDGDGHGDEDEPVPVAHTSSSGGRPAPRKGKGFTGSFMLVLSKIARSRQKRPEKSRPPTNPTQRKKAKNNCWQKTSPADGGPQDPILSPSYNRHIVGEEHIEVAVPLRVLDRDP